MQQVQRIGATVSGCTAVTKKGDRTAAASAAPAGHVPPHLHIPHHRPAHKAGAHREHVRILALVHHLQGRGEAPGMRWMEAHVEARTACAQQNFQGPVGKAPGRPNRAGTTAQPPRRLLMPPGSTGAVAAVLRGPAQPPRCCPCRQHAPARHAAGTTAGAALTRMLFSLMLRYWSTLCSVPVIARSFFSSTVTWGEGAHTGSRAGPHLGGQRHCATCRG